MAELTEKQQKYYDVQVDIYKSIRVQGKGIAVPYGFIRKKAEKMTDADLDKLFARQELTIEMTLSPLTGEDHDA